MWQLTKKGCLPLVHILVPMEYHYELVPILKHLHQKEQGNIIVLVSTTAVNMFYTRPSK